MSLLSLICIAALIRFVFRSVRASPLHLGEEQKVATPRPDPTQDSFVYGGSSGVSHDDGPRISLSVLDYDLMKEFEIENVREVPKINDFGALKKFYWRKGKLN